MCISRNSQLWSDFNGVSLSGGDVLLNPDLDLAHELKGWWESEGCRQEDVTSITVSGARGGEGSGGTARIIGEVKQENLGLGEKGDYYNVIATVTFFRCVPCSLIHLLCSCCILLLLKRL